MEDELVDAWEPARAQVWRRDLVADAVSAARDELAALSRSDALRSAEQTLRGRRSTSLRGELARYALAVAALELAAAEGPSQGDRVRAFHAEATRCLRRVGIGRKGSRLSGLYLGLEETARSASPTRAAPWELPNDAAHSRAMGGLLDGGPEVCLRLLEDRLAGAHDAADAASLHLAGARVLRLGARFDEACARLERVRGDAHADAKTWELAAIESMRAGDPSSLLRALRTGAVARTGARMLELYLWTRASRTKAHLRELPTAAALRRAAGGEADPAAWHAALVLDRAYKASLPLSSRVASVLRALQKIEAVVDPALLVLSVAALARFLARFKQPAESARVAACYRALCLSTSDGTSADVFSFAIGDGSDAPVEPEAPRAFDGSVWRMGIELFKAKARSLGSGANAMEDYAEILAFHLSALKGPIMKLGQVLSFYGVPLPEESRELLAALHDDATPIPFAVVRGVLESELHRRVDETFAELDESPLSTGSVGQVHRGVLRSGERVVVKVQLPGITERMERDFRALRLLLPLASGFFPTWDLRGIVAELRERMVLECDYAHEASAQGSFRRRLADDPEIVVPRVFEALSTPRVLVSELFDGQTFTEFSRAATQAERNRAGETIVRYAIRTTVVERSFNTDMHPGNLLFSDGRVCFVDFGNVRAWSDESSVGWREMLLGTVADDVRRVERGLRRLAILHAPEGSFSELYGQMSKLLFGVLHEPGPVRVSKETLIAELLRFLPSKHQIARDLQMPPAYAYAFRMYWGMFAILADLGAEVRFREVTIDALERYGDAATRASAAALRAVTPTRC